jgi:hypothetical protein
MRTNRYIGDRVNEKSFLKDIFFKSVSETFQFSETDLKEHFILFEKQMLKTTFRSPCIGTIKD